MIIAGAYITENQAVTLSQKSFHFDGLSEMKTLIQSAPEQFVTADLENFRRAGTAVRLAQLSSILAVSDIPTWNSTDTACLGWNGAGCSLANQAYWDDYLAHGRETGRGTLFVPTLPSIPICEAAIALHIHGPTWHCKTAAYTQLLFDVLEDLHAETPEIKQALICEVNDHHACALLWKPGEKEPACQNLTELFFLYKGEPLA